MKRVAKFVLLAGCGAKAPDAAPPMTKAPRPPARFAPGPALSPTDALLAWLKQQGGERRPRLRLPVVVTFSDGHLGVAQAFVGTSIDEPSVGRVHLHLDDSAMGVSLIDHLRRACDPFSSRCAVWLEGMWGPLVQGLPDFGGPTAPERWPFGVLALAEPQPEPRAYVEAP